MRDSEWGSGAADRQEQIVEALSRSVVFRGVSRDDLDPYLPAIRWREYKRGANITELNDDVESLVVIARGSARLLRCGPNGRDVTLATLSAGHVFGLSYCSPHVGRHGTLIAMSSEVAACTIPRPSFRALVAGIPVVALNALEVSGEGLVALGDHVEELAVYKIAERLGHELARLATGSDEQYVGATQEDLASFIAAGPCDVSRTLAEFRDRNLINSQPYHHGVWVVDRETLAELGREGSSS